MNKYDVYCKGPFPDGRGHECWVRVLELELPEGQDPRRQLSKYMCSTCGVAESVIRPLCQRNLIPWWDPDYRKSVIAALEIPCRIFPHEKIDASVKGAYDEWERRQSRAVIAALSTVLRRERIPEREIVRYVMSRRPTAVAMA